MSTSSLNTLSRSIRKLTILSLLALAFMGGAVYLKLTQPTTATSLAVSRGAFPDPAIDLPTPQTKGTQTLVLAGGCFWGVEAVFEHLNGVVDVVSGYAGGSAETAHYGLVSFGQTGHAESVKITYDPAHISYGQLLKVYFSVAHDPTQVNRQGPDTGTQYRSVIFFENTEQQRVAQAYIDQLNQAHTLSKPIATQLTPLNGFYAAEADHQNFIDRNPNYPYVVVHDLPKLKQLKEQFSDRYKPSAFESLQSTATK